MLNKYKTKLVEKKQLTNDVYLFKFQLQDNQKIYFNAGQYLIMEVPQTQGDGLKRLYSIASSADEKESFEILVKILPAGKAGNYLKNLDLDAEVIFTGPAGLFHFQPITDPVFFLATGTGIAPILSILRTLSSRQPLITDRKIILYWGLRNKTEVCLFDELLKISQTVPNFDFKICLSRENNLEGITEENKKHYSIGRINLDLPKLQAADYYLCGNPLVVDALKNELLHKGIGQEKIHLEKF